MRTFRDRRGFTLPLTIIVIVVIGILASTFYGMVKSERIETFHRFQETQATLELESGVNYAFFRMQEEHKPWRTDSLEHASPDSSIRFSMEQSQDGPFAKLTIFNHDSSKSFSAHTGFIPPTFPALTLLAAQANISLTGDARIEGGAAAKVGSLSYSSHYKMRAGKDAFFDTMYVSDTLHLFDTLRFYPELSRKQFQKEFETEKCVLDGTDNVPSNDTLKCKTVIMQGDSHCEDCHIKAERIFIRERAHLRNAFVTASNISLKGKSLLSGTFFAQDTLEVALDRKQESSLRLILQGRKTAETTYAGLMDFQKLQASNALVIFIGDNWDETLKSIPVNVSDSVDIRGALIANGFVNFSGKLTGMMISYHFGFYEDATLWRGFLRGGKIISDTTIHPFLPDIVYLGGEASYEK